MQLFSKRPLALASLLLLLSSLFTYLIIANGMPRSLGLIPFVVFLLLSVLLLVFRRRGHLFLLLGITIALLFGFLSQFLYDNVRHRPWRETDSGKPHALVATVTDYEEEDGGITYTLSVSKLDGRDVRLLILLHEEVAGVIHKPGVRLRCYATVREKDNRFHYRNGIAGTATALSLTAIGKEDRPLSEALTGLRRLLSDRIREGVKGEGAALTVALLLGNKEGISEALSNDFQRAGLSHMLALSGLHLSILGMLLLRLLQGLGTPRHVSFPLLIVFLLAYTVISGFPLSLIRAALMLTVAELGKLLRLFNDPVTSLFFSVALIVLVSPSAIVDVGLLLSFLATLGILIGLEVFPRSPRSLLGKLSLSILLALLSTVFAVAFTLPVTAVVFGGFSLISPLSNLIVSPLIHLILIIGPLTLLFPSLMSPLAQMVADITVNTVRSLSGIRGVYLFTSYPLFILALILFSLYLLSLLLRRISHRGFLVRFLSSLGILIAVLIGSHFTATREELLLYTRQGTEEFVTLRAEGYTTVISRAKGGSALFLLGEELASHHISEIDLLVLSCYEEETSSYLEELVGRIPVRSLLLVPPLAEDEGYRNTVSTAERLKIPFDAKEALQKGGVTLGFAGARDEKEAHDGLFFKISYNNTELRYVTEGYLKTVDGATLDVFLKEADLLILGAHAACEEVGTVPLPPDLTVLVAVPKTAPENLQKEKEGVLLSPDTFVYRIP